MQGLALSRVLPYWTLCALLPKRIPKLDKIPKKYFCWLLHFFSIFSARLDKRLFFKNALIDGRALPWIEGSIIFIFYSYFYFRVLKWCSHSFFRPSRLAIEKKSSSDGLDQKKPSKLVSICNWKIDDWWTNKCACSDDLRPFLGSWLARWLMSERSLVWFLLRSCSWEPAIMICLLWAHNHKICFSA